MCGIAGYINKNHKVNPEIFSGMLNAIAHRGPEDEGVWFNEEKKVALGHRRLAIIDLTSGGHQPMISNDGRFVITFNGEIYNYLEIKEELLKIGYVFKTNSDTEVLLNSYIEWQEKCLEKLNGMFAFAVFDNQDKVLFAARDRMGEKPFKYYYDDDKFVFASEIKAILQDRGIKKEVDWQAIDVALNFRYVPSPYTGFKNIFKLSAGHYLIYKDGDIIIKKYWNLNNVKVDRTKLSKDLKDEIWELFKDSVKKRLISDVPVGAFLSGGLDSTSVVLALKEIGRDKIDTYVISVGGFSKDQNYAKLAANYFNTNHHEIELKDIDYSKALDKLVFYYDEPFFDQSALPSMLISEQIKKNVTVVLSGDGGDELFGGYDNYRFAKFLLNYQKLPKILYKIIFPFLAIINKKLLYRCEVLSKDFFSAYTEYFSVWKNNLPLSKMYYTKTDLYLPEFKNSVDINKGVKLMKEWFVDKDGIVNRAMLADITGRLADGYMTKTDIATMISAVELRPPFLDYRLVELSQKISDKFKNNKFIWKEIVKNKLPKEIIERKKVGFSIPLDKLLLDNLKSLVVNTLLDKNAMIYEKFSFDTVKAMWVDHQNHKADYSNHIWSLLTLELWLRKYHAK